MIDSAVDPGTKLCTEERDSCKGRRKGDARDRLLVQTRPIFWFHRDLDFSKVVVSDPPRGAKGGPLLKTNWLG